MMTAVAAIMLAQQLSSLQGRVVRWGTSDPVARATVELVRVEAGAPAPYVTRTNLDGAFVFSDIPAGQYRVIVTRQGYVNAEYGQRWPAGAGAPLTIPAGQIISNVPVPMLQTGAISGVVRDQSGRPLGNAEVDAFKASYQTGRRVLTKVQAVPSDDRGEYRLFWLAPGRYFVSARHADLSSSPMRMGGVMIGGGGPGGSKYQQFRTSGDNAAAARVPFDQRVANEKYMSVYYPNSTDESSATAIEVVPGGEASAIDFVLAPIPLRRIRGRVVSESNNEPAMSARVQWISSTGMSASENDGFPLGPIGVATPVQCCDGAFELGLPTGTYTLIAAVSNLNGRTSVTVGDTDVDGVVITVGRGFSIKGTVTFEGRTPSPAERDAFRISLAMDPPVTGLTPTSYSTILPTGAITVQAGRGDFRVSIMPLLPVPGGVNLRPPNLPASLSGMYVKSIRLGNADVLNRGLHLNEETPDVLEIVISTVTGTLAGTVTNGNGQPLGGVTVAVVPDRARRSRFDLMKSTSSDASGRFRFDGLPPGAYVAFAFDGADDGEWRNVEYIATRESQGTAVRIDPAAPLSIELVALMP